MTRGLRIDGISHAYGAIQAVRDLSLSVEAGEIVALLGPSGCGKSTVLRISAGLENVQSGRVSIDGQSVAEPGHDQPPEARSVGLMFQDFALFPHLDVRRNVGFGLRGRPVRERDAVVKLALDRVGLAHKARDYPHALSGGEQQRVALARALAPDPKVMLLDEPFSDLDVVLRDRIRETTAAILRENGTPTLMVTHDPEEAMMMADRIALMRNGAILQEGQPNELYRAPESACGAAFIGEANVLDATVSGGVSKTPLGAVPADGLADGTPVTVLIRPEGLHLNAENGVAATVREIRNLGRSGLVTIELAGGPAMKARVFWPGLPKVGDQIRVSADPAMTFVFPAADR
jgi:iron(III) transport system ATP-binding protein